MHNSLTLIGSLYSLHILRLPLHPRLKLPGSLRPPYPIFPPIKRRKLGNSFLKRDLIACLGVEESFWAEYSASTNDRNLLDVSGESLGHRASEAEVLDQEGPDSSFLDRFSAMHTSSRPFVRLFFQALFSFPGNLSFSHHRCKDAGVDAGRF